MLKCLRCCVKFTDADIIPKVERAGVLVPKCPECGYINKIISIDEGDDRDDYIEALHDTINTLMPPVDNRYE